jgi:hypothetical protein
MERKYSSEEIVDNMKIILEICKTNEELYKNSKNEMMVKIREWDPEFYGRHYRVCKSIVFENIDDLLVMIESMKHLEQKTTTLEAENNKVQNNYNKIYIKPILEKKELVEERERKMAAEKK